MNYIIATSIKRVIIATFINIIAKNIISTLIENVIATLTIKIIATLIESGITIVIAVLVGKEITRARFDCYYYQSREVVS